MWKNLAVDLSPLKRREFRLLSIGQLISQGGTAVTMVAVPFQMYALTGSSVAVGLVGAVEFLPMIIIALYAGALADAFDRRKLVMLAEVGGATAVVGLAVNAGLAHPHTWVLYVASAAAAAAYGLLRPPLDAILPRIIPPEELKAAIAIDWSRSSIGQLGGPALGGVLIASVGLSTTYLVDIASFGGSLLALSMMRAVPAPENAAPPSLDTIKAGLRYARSQPHILGTYLVDINAMFFGMPLALFPALAKRYGGAELLGLLYAAPEAGALLVTATSGWTRHVHRHGAAVVLAGAGWGVFIVGLGFANSAPLAIVFLALAGASDSISGLFRAAIWRESVPDSMRGRLAGIEMVSYVSGPTLGNVEAGLVAGLTSVRTSVVSGGVLCIVGAAAFGAAIPKLWRYTPPKVPIEA